MSTKFQPPRKDPARGILFASPPAFAGQGMGVSQPVIHLETPDRETPDRETPDRETRDRTNAFGRPQTYKNVLEKFPSPLKDLPAIGSGPTLGGISSGGAANDH